MFEAMLSKNKKYPAIKLNKKLEMIRSTSVSVALISNKQNFTGVI